MTDAFSKQRRTVEQSYQGQLAELQKQRQSIEASVREQARQQISNLEVQKQQVLAELYKQQEAGQRHVALGEPYTPLEAEQRGVEEKALSLQEATKEELETALKDVKKQVKAGKTSLSGWKKESLADVEKAEVEWKASNVELSTGEWVPKQDYDAYPPEYQTKLTELGTEKFNAMIMQEQATAAAAQQTFEAVNVKLSTGEWTPKEPFNALTPEQQALLIKVGVDEFNRQQQVAYDTAINITPQQAFQNLQASGEVPKYAVYKGVDETTGQISYEIPPWKNIPVEDIRPTAEQHSQLAQQFASLNMDQQQDIAGAATGLPLKFPGLLRGRSFTDEDISHEITQHTWGKDYWDRILSFYQSQILSSPNPVAAIDVIHRAAIEQGTTLLTSFIPIYGTVRNWDNMSPVWRGISIIADIAIVAPFIKAGLSALVTSRLPIVTAAKQLAKAELTSVKQLTRQLATTYGRDVASSFAKTERALADYIEQLGRATQAGTKASARLLSVVDTAEQTLRAAAKTYADELSSATSKLKGIKDIPILLDNPQVAAMLRNLPDDIVDNARAAVEGLKPKDMSILQEAVKRAQKELDNARATYPTEPTMWVEAAQQLGKTQARLTMAETGNAASLIQKLIEAREALKNVQTALDATMDIKEITKLQTEADHLKVLIKQLEAGYKDVLYNAENQWAEMGSKFSEWRSGGSAATQTKPRTPTRPIVGGGGGRPTSLARIPVAGAVRVAVKTLAIKPTTGTTTPEVVKEIEEAAQEVSEISAITSPEVVAITEAAVRAANEAAIKGMSMPDIRSAAITASEVEIQRLVDTEAITQTEAETLTRALTETATKIATKTKLRLKTEEKLRTKTEEEEEEEKQKEKTLIEVPDGTWTWKQGFGWRSYLPPYDAVKPLFSLNPPARAIKTNLRTPSETIQIIGDPTNVPDTVSIDLGVVDILLRKKPKPSITFRGVGLKTDIGERVPGPTIGLSAPAKWEAKPPPIDIGLPTLSSMRLSLGPIGLGSIDLGLTNKKQDLEVTPELKEVL